MANSQFSGSGPGVEDARPPASPTAVPTLEEISELAQRLAAALIAFTRGAAATEQPPPAPVVVAAAGDVDDDDDDEEEEEGLEVDDGARRRGRWGDPPIKELIEAERDRIDLADSILAGVDADLDAEELHLSGQRVSNGNHQDVICLVRRMLRKTVNHLDNVYVGPLVEQAVATALEMHAKGETKFDPYDDTPATHTAKRAADARLAAQAGGGAASGA